MTWENGEPVVCAELTKALCGTVQAALLFWQNLTHFLKKQGFETNPYDFCVMNKNINGKQCTIGWHIDDLKISHVEKDVVENIVDALQANCGKEAPLTVHRGEAHDYLGMTIDFSTPGKVIFTMKDCIDGPLAEAPDDLFKGRVPTSCAANHLFAVREDATPLNEEDAEMFHHLTAKLLCLCKRTRPDLQLPTTFLCTRVRGPDVDDWKKLGRCLSFLRATRDDPFTLEATSTSIINWWVDASFAAHPDFRSHTGATMTLGKGCPINLSAKQKINTRSSTEAEVVGADDAVALIAWTKLFLEHQGFAVADNVIFQDNQSAMLLEKNGKQSSGKKTRHIEIRHYFITDNVRRGNATVEHCPTEDMIADYFTKPLQGRQFRRFRAFILNLPSDHADVSKPCTQERVESVRFEVCPRSVSTNKRMNAEPLITSTKIQSYAEVARKGLESRSNALVNTLTLLS